MKLIFSTYHRFFLYPLGVLFCCLSISTFDARMLTFPGGVMVDGYGYNPQVIQPQEAQLPTPCLKVQFTGSKKQCQEKNVKIVIKCYVTQQFGYFLPKELFLIIEQYIPRYYTWPLLPTIQSQCMQVGEHNPNLKKKLLWVFNKLIAEPIYNESMKGYHTWSMSYLSCNNLLYCIQKVAPLLELILSNKVISYRSKYQNTYQKKVWIQMFQDPRYQVENSTFKKSVVILVYKKTIDGNMSDNYKTPYQNYYRDSPSWEGYHLKSILIKGITAENTRLNKKYLERIKKQFPDYENLILHWKDIEVNKMKFFPNYHVTESNSSEQSYGVAADAVIKIPYYTHTNQPDQDNDNEINNNAQKSSQKDIGDKSNGYLRAEWILVFKNKQIRGYHALLTKVMHNKKIYLAERRNEQYFTNISELNSYLISHSLSFAFTNRLTYSNGQLNIPVSVQEVTTKHFNE